MYEIKYIYLNTFTEFLYLNTEMNSEVLILFK